MPKLTETEKALAFLNVMKGLDPASLRDVEQIASVTDGHADRDGIPSKTEVPTSESMPMRGGAAAPIINANSNTKPQEGMVRDYETFSRRMDQMEKSVTALSNILVALKKAADGPSDRFMHEVDTTKDVEKALRKARMAVRKAESAEDEEEVAEITEKAEAALKACEEELEKAEEKVETEEEEKFCEKSLGELTNLRKSLRAKKAARVKKAEEEVKVREEEEARKAAAAVAAKAESGEDDDMAKAAAALKSIGLGDLFATMSAAVKSQTSVASAPDYFSKSHVPAVPFSEALAKAGLEPGEESMAESLHSRLEMVKSNHLPKESFTQALQAAPENVRALFNAPK